MIENLNLFLLVFSQILTNQGKWACAHCTGAGGGCFGEEKAPGEKLQIYIKCFGHHLESFVRSVLNGLLAIGNNVFQLGLVVWCNYEGQAD